MLKPHAPIQTPEGQPDPLNIVRPLVGYGPESMWVAYNRFYPPDLAHYEARNASPDRSHNETFDTLVRGGLIQFAAQIFLYVSIFYYSLRWLGLMRGRRRRNLFSRVAGRGRRAGRDRPADRRRQPAPGGHRPARGTDCRHDRLCDRRFAVERPGRDPGRSPAAPADTTSGRRQLLILVLFAAIVAHFVEVHFGIAIASTLTLFWVLAGALVPVGMGWVEDEDRLRLRLRLRLRPTVALKTQPGGVKAQPAAASSGKPKTTKATRPQDARQPQGSPVTKRAAASQPARQPGPLLLLLPYAADRRPDHAGAHLGFHPHGRSHRRDHPWRLPLGRLHQPVERRRLHRRSLADAAGHDDLHLAHRRGVGRGRKRTAPAVGRRADDLSRCNGRHVADLRSGRVEPDDTRGPERSGCVPPYRRTRGAVRHPAACSDADAGRRAGCLPTADPGLQAFLAGCRCYRWASVSSRSLRHSW